MGHVYCDRCGLPIGFDQKAKMLAPDRYVHEGCSVENFTVTHHTQLFGTYPWWRLIRRFRAWLYERRRQREWDALDPTVQQAVIQHRRDLERAALFGTDVATHGFAVLGPDGERVDPADLSGPVDWSVEAGTAEPEAPHGYGTGDCTCEPAVGQLGSAYRVEAEIRRDCPVHGAHDDDEDSKYECSCSPGKVYEGCDVHGIPASLRRIDKRSREAAARGEPFPSSD